ncbi:rac GTPase-activating protein 1-like isoform X2 [Narcine bancroftii]|uniref:rac GTPase-activating protein 1-like isoform X2 n=1 Tax=Narcine bancroftii TaxID=1343680 RepID=UPI0038320600
MRLTIFSFAGLMLAVDERASGQQVPLPTPEACPRVPEGLASPDHQAPSRPHLFISKTIICLENCVPCGKRIRFGKVALKCRACCLVSHPECRTLCPTLCAPNLTSALVKNGEPGIYCVPGCERRVRELRECYMRGKGLPPLSHVFNIHIICGLLKDFLQRLKEPVVTFQLQPTFLASTGLSDEQSRAELFRAVSMLPRANRETLAYLIVHLQRVMGSPECRMDRQKLARVFGPTLVGHARPNPRPMEMIEDSKQQPQVVEHLLSLPSEFWNQFVHLGWEEEEQVACGPNEASVYVPGCLFPPLTSPDAAKIKLSSSCFPAHGLLSLAGSSYPGKLFSSLIPK